MLLARGLRAHWARVFGLVAALAIAGGSWDHSEAKSSRSQAKPRAIHGPNYRPPYADIVIDDKTGEVLHAVDADAPRRPASLTKIMMAPQAFAPVPGGWGRQGWTTATLAALSVAELKDALTTAWRHAVPKPRPRR